MHGMSSRQACPVWRWAPRRRPSPACWRMFAATYNPVGHCNLCVRRGFCCGSLHPRHCPPSQHCAETPGSGQGSREAAGGAQAGRYRAVETRSEPLTAEARGAALRTAPWRSVGCIQGRWEPPACIAPRVKARCAKPLLPALPAGLRKPWPHRGGGRECSGPRGSRAGPAAGAKPAQRSPPAPPLPAARPAGHLWHRAQVPQPRDGRGGGREEVQEQDRWRGGCCGSGAATLDATRQPRLQLDWPAARGLGAGARQARRRGMAGRQAAACIS